MPIMKRSGVLALERGWSDGEDSPCSGFLLILIKKAIEKKRD